MNLERISIAVIAIVTAVLAAYLAIGTESYCVIYPSIDTRYAAGFSERKFAEIRVGMTKEEVLRILGAPMHGMHSGTSGKWSYTQDGKCFWADWAWLGREIVFVDNRVVEKVSRVYND